MRTGNTFGIDFVVRHDKKDKAVASIYARITVDGDIKEISLKQKVVVTQWDSRSERIKGKGTEQQRLNAHIDNVRFLLTEKYRMLQDKGAAITAEAVKVAYLGQLSRPEIAVHKTISNDNRKEKARPTLVSKRKPPKRLDSATKTRIIREITSGITGFKQASRKYRVARNTLKNWVREDLVQGLLENMDKKVPDGLTSVMPTNKLETDTDPQIREITKKLGPSRLKVESLETMIIVAEEDLKIKIRKKRGTKQSKECGKVGQI